MRKQLIEYMARAAFLDNHPGEDWSKVGPMTRNLYIRNQTAVFDYALTAAGMVVVPKADLQDLIADSENGEWGNVADDLRAMTEAANG